MIKFLPLVAFSIVVSISTVCTREATGAFDSTYPAVFSASVAEELFFFGLSLILDLTVFSIPIFITQ